MFATNFRDASADTRALQDALRLDHEQRAQFKNNGRSWTAKNCNPESYGETLVTLLTNASGRSSGLRI